MISSFIMAGAFYTFSAKTFEDMQVAYIKNKEPKQVIIAVQPLKCDRVIENKTKMYSICVADGKKLYTHYSNIQIK